MRQLNGIVIILLFIIAIELGVIAAKLPLSPAQAQQAPVPVVITDGSPATHACSIVNCAKVDQGGVLRVNIYR